MCVPVLISLFNWLSFLLSNILSKHLKLFSLSLHCYFPFQPGSWPSKRWYCANQLYAKKESNFQQLGKFFTVQFGFIFFLSGLLHYVFQIEIVSNIVWCHKSSHLFGLPIIQTNCREYCYSAQPNFDLHFCWPRIQYTDSCISMVSSQIYKYLEGQRLKVKVNSEVGGQ